MRHPATLLLATLALATLSPASLADGDADAGRDKSTVCAACHGGDGNSMNPVWPSLAGQHAGYLVEQMEAFRTGMREDPLMSAQAAGLSAEDIQDLAAFYAAQPMRVPAATADDETIALGERLYRGGNPNTGIPACIACHGPNGRGNPAAGYAAIGGQQGDYVAKALRDYAAEARITDPERMMRDVAHLMTEREIQAVAAYVQGLN